jgi:hypothetical protein
MKGMKKSERPLVVTDATGYDDVAGHSDAVASIRRGLTQAKKGLGRPVDDVFNELERESCAT